MGNALVLAAHGTTSPPIARPPQTTTGTTAAVRRPLSHAIERRWDGHDGDFVVLPTGAAGARPGWPIAGFDFERRSGHLPKLTPLYRD
jgi:hypothetical protein